MTGTPSTNRSHSIATGLGGVLIVGLAHSGKTEVRRIVETSDRVHATRRVRHWAHIANTPGDPLASADLLDSASFVRHDGSPVSSDLDLSEVLTTWRSLEGPTFGGMLALLHHEEATRHGAEIWCAQVNRIESLIERILVELPAIKVVHTIRDPRDGLGVSRRSGIVGRRGWDLASWELSARVAVASRDRHPGRYMIVRWEDLVASPQSVCGSLGQFVGAELTVPDDWQPAGKPIGRGVRGKRTHSEIASLVDALGYDTAVPTPDSPVSDVVDLACYRIRSRRLRRRARGSIR